jgi:hypothetical protein
MNKNHKSYSYSLLSTALAGITLVILLVALHGINTEAAPLRGPGTGDDPEIRFVTMTSDLPHYDPRDGEGITKTVYFSNEVAGTITMTFDITGTPMLSLTAGAAFEQGERVYTSSTEPLTQPVTYTVGTGGTQPNIGYTTTNTDGVTTTVAISYVQDITAPMVSINSPAAGSVLTTAHQPTVTIGGTASDDPSGLSEVRVTTGTTWAEAEGLDNWDYTWTLPIIDNIEYRLKAQAIDNADNVSTTTEVSVTVDTVAPTATAPVPHTSPWVTSTVVYTWAESSDSADIAGYRVRITNTEGYEVISSTDESVLTFTEALTEGAGYYARARAIDNNGNVDMWSDPSDVVTPDLTPPTISNTRIDEEETDFFHVVEDLHLYYTNTMDFAKEFKVEGDSSDDDSGVAQVQFSEALGKDPDPVTSGFSDWESSSYSIDSTTTASGTITATVYDNAGNTAVQTYTYALDSKPPTSTASSPDYVTSGSIDVTWIATDTQSGVYSTTLWYKKAASSTWRSYATQHPVSDTFSFDPPYGDGTYLFSTVAADNLGNLEAGRTVSETWTVYATEVPQADVTDTPAYENSSPITVTWVATPATGSLVEVHLWYRYNEGNWNSTSYTSTGRSGDFYFDPPGDDGTYDFAVVAQDEYGKSDGEPLGDNGVEGTTIYDTTDPAVTLTAPEHISETTFTVSWSAEDATSGVAYYTLKYSSTATSGWESWGDTYTDTTQTTFDGAEAETDYTFRVTAYDEAGNSSDDVTTTYVGAFNIYLPLTVRNYAPFSNSSFERMDSAGNPLGWEVKESKLPVSVASNVQERPSGSTPPSDGNKVLLLGNPGYACDNVPNPANATAEQTFTLPKDATKLTFKYIILTQDASPSGKYDRFEVYVNNQLVFDDGNQVNEGLSCSNWWRVPGKSNQRNGKTSDWAEGEIDLTDYSGNVTISFQNHSRFDKWYNTYTYIDDIRVE